MLRTGVSTGKRLTLVLQRINKTIKKAKISSICNLVMERINTERIFTV